MMEERTESQGFYEMLWDCDHCETKGLLAKSQRHCAECGAKQNPDKRYFPPEGAEVRVDGHKYEGADRVCPACSAAISARAKNCTNCGSPQDGAQEVKGVEIPKVVKAPRRIWPIVVIVIVAVLLLGFAIWYFFIRTKSATLTVTAHRWERAIKLEQFGEYHESRWRSEGLPATAERVICHREQHGTKQVQDGEECTKEKKDKKDGTFEVVNKCKPKYRSEPVYEDKCDYTVRMWKEIDEKITLAAKDMNPQWPTKNVPAANTQAQIGARRSGKRVETYTLEFGEQKCDVSEPVWRKYADGAKVKVEVRARSESIVCDSL